MALDPLAYSFLADVRYGVVRPKFPAIRMVCRVDETEPVRRRGYLRAMYASREYRNMSRRLKNGRRRVILNTEVPCD